MGFINTILDMVFPSKCIACGEKGEELCLSCLSSSRVAERESANWIFPSYDYRDPNIKKALWLLKYKNKKGFAKIFAEIIYDKILEELSELEALENFREPILIPIPLSRARRRERGYNQAELICQELVKINSVRLGVNIKLENDILKKIKDTPHQAKIRDRKERLRNICGSFSIKNIKIDLLKNKNIILIDDILTTGATLGEARKVLKHAGARKIIAFTVAH